MTTTTRETFATYRRAYPYTTAREAIYLARADVAAAAAGIPRDPAWSTDLPVTIGDREYLLTVERDDDAGSPADMGDCYGIVTYPRRGYWREDGFEPVSPDWPTVRDGGQEWTYYPGDTYDADYRPRGASRSVGLEMARANLLAEGWRIHRHLPGFAPMFWSIGLRDAADNGGIAWIGGVDGIDGPAGRAHVWDVARDLAWQLAAEATQRAEDARQALAMATAHG